MKKFFKIFVFAAAAMSASAPLFGALVDKLSANEAEKICSATPKNPAATPKKERKALMYSKTCSYRHVSGIPAAKLAMVEMGDRLGVWEIDVSENPSDFEKENLKKYDFVILNNSTGMCFGASSKELKSMSPEESKATVENSKRLLGNLLEFVKNGGGVFAIHAGVDAYRNGDIKDPGFIEMVGGNFLYHPWTIDGAPATIFVEDETSPITKGIWDTPTFRVEEEIYMFGDDFSRDKVRVLMRVDADKSPRTSEYGLKSEIRKDKDIPLAWIKKYGKGRFAYGGFGHDWRNYANPKIQELYLRLAQFAAGDLDADTAPLKMKEAPAERIPLSPKVCTKEISTLSKMKEGESDEKINDIAFGIFANSGDLAYSQKIRNFIFDEISSGNGTETYREYLAEFLLGAGLKDSKEIENFSKLAKSQKNRAVKDRLDEAVARAKEGGKILDKEKPGKICKNWSDERTARFLIDNPEAEIPSRLKNLDGLSPNLQSMMIYALANRSDEESGKILGKAKPKGEASVVALAYAAAKRGSDVEKILGFAEKLKDPKMRQIAVAYILEIKSDKTVEILRGILRDNSASRDRKQLASEAVSATDLSYLGKGLFDNYESKSPAEKMEIFKLAVLISNAEMFDSSFKAMLGEKDKKVSNAAKRAVMKCASQNFDDASVEKIAVEMEKNPYPPEVCKFLLKILHFNGGEAALEIVEKFASEGFQEEAVESLGKWRSQNALPVLVEIAKAANDKRTKILAQIGMVEVAQRAKIDIPTFGYLAENALRAQELETAIVLANKRTSIAAKRDAIMPQAKKRVAELKAEKGN